MHTWTCEQSLDFFSSWLRAFVWRTKNLSFQAVEATIGATQAGLTQGGPQGVASQWSANLAVAWLGFCVDIFVDKIISEISILYN